MNKVEFSRTAKAPFQKRYGNFIGGKWAEPKKELGPPSRYYDASYYDAAMRGMQ